MDINRGSMDLLFKGFNMLFQKGLTMAPDTWTQFAGVIPSSTAINVYPFLEQFGGMREWLDDRHIKNVASKKLEVKNKDWEDTVSLPRNDIEDDQYGIYGILIQQMGQNAGKLNQELATTALLSSDTWLDDVAFFSSARTYGDYTIDNTVATALSSSTFETAFQKMMEYKGHSGKFLGVRPDLLIVGPKLRKTAWDIVENTHVTDGATSSVPVQNSQRNLVKMQVIHELSGAYDDYWFLAQTSGVLRPVIVQQRKAPVLVRMDRETDANVFFKKNFIYGTDARATSFKSFPHLIYKGGTGV